MTAASPTPTTRRDWLRLARTEGVGPVGFADLMGRYGGDAAAVLDALPELAKRAGRATPLKIMSVADANAELARGQEIGAKLLISGETAFPRLLAHVDPPPPVIWVRGDPRLLARPTVALVGARVASAAGQRFARSLAQELGQAGYLVISGMARGVDTAAHEGSLLTGTVAVLGGGVDDVYPLENKDLYRRIAADGCIVSESPVGHRAQARDFPRRNRLISGLSLGVVVVEAEMRSGSLITARLAGEQGREVFAVPGSPLDPRAAGCNDLLRQGATLCAEADDVLRVLNGLRGFDEPPPEAYRGKGVEVSVALLNRIADLLTDAPVSRDDLARAAGVSAAEVSAALVELSLAGRAEFLPGGKVSR